MIDTIFGWRSDFLSKHGPALSYHLLGFRPNPPEEPEKHREVLAECFKTMLESGKMIVGESFIAGGDKLTVADFHVWPILVWLQSTKVYDLPEGVIKYIERLQT